MRTGRVVQFDEARGYGFITPEDGGEDVFVHVNMMGNERWSVAPGVPVEFEATESNRGPKALTIRVLKDGATEAAGLADAAAPAFNTASAPVGPTAQAAPVAVTTGSTSEDEDGVCDVLSERALSIEVTEALLTALPDLTAAQVLGCRREMLTLARRHGWVEDD